MGRRGTSFVASALHDREIMNIQRNFVSPEPIHSQNRASVLATWQENAGGGIGIFTFVVGMRVLLQIIGAALGFVESPLPSLENMQLWLMIAAVLGIILFGVLMIVRSSLDELVQYGEWQAMAAEIEELEQQVSELETELEAVQLSHQNAIDSLADARRALHQNMAVASTKYRAPEQPTEPPVQRDARWLLKLAYGGSKWGRDYIVKTYDDWTPTRWTAARNILEEARIARTVGNRTELLYGDEATAATALSAHCQPNSSQFQSETELVQR